METVILVDKHDTPVGTMEKMEAHRQGALHRALSVFVFNDRKEMLLHKRAAEKYHSAGLWTNACCSHPRPEEKTLDAAHRRLQEEMGMSCPLDFQFTFLYQAPFDNGLTEHELDHIFFGMSNATPLPNPAEVAEYAYVGIEEVKQKIVQDPHLFTVWFKSIMDLPLFYEKLREKNLL